MDKQTTDQKCNCGAQDRSNHRPHKPNCAVYPKPKSLTFAELGKIILEKAVAEACANGYRITDPANNLEDVGRQAILYGDINRDGTLN